MNMSKKRGLAYVHFKKAKAGLKAINAAGTPLKISETCSGAGSADALVIVFM